MAGPNDFYNAVYSTARDLGANDIQARLAAAQASEETGFGKSMVGNNLFGIKAGSNYTGNSVTAGTNEEYGGVLSRENANFRAYDDFTNSVKDYLGVVQSNFPDAWNANSFSDAVKGLNTGVYGKYASLSDYGNHIKSIDNKYGGVQYAANPENVPTPYGPNDPAPEVAVANDVLPMAEPNFAPVDPNAASYEFAANPQNVPVPTQNTGLLNAYQDQQPVSTPFDAVLAPQKQASEWGVLNGVGPVYTPTVNSWADVSAAPVVKSPLGSVTASGDLAANAPLEAQTRAVPMMNVPAAGLLAGNAPLEASATAGLLSSPAPAISQADVERAFFNPTGQGQFDPSFTAGLMGPDNPVVPTAVQTTSYTQPQSADIASSRFATPAKTDRIGTSQTMADPARMNPLTGAINPATNTQSFMPDPAATGVYSAEHQQVQDAARAALDRALQTQVQRQAAASVTPSGILGTPTELAATATANVPAQTAGAKVPSVDPTVTGSTTPGLFTPGLLADVKPNFTPSSSRGILAEQPINQVGFLPSLPSNIDVNLSGNIVPARDVAPVETVQVAEQPTIADQSATFDGPATTPALTQQKTATTNTLTQPTKTQPTVQAAQNTKSFKDSLFSKETALGGLLGGMALGPVGGILGALGGQQVAANGGLTGLLGGGFAQPTTQVPGGIVNIGGIYGGRYAPGTYAMANNGAQISSLGGGYTGMVTPSGMHEVISPTGQISHNFGSFGSRPTDPNTAV